MISPRNVRFFNRDWQFIGDKKTLAKSLKRITRVPEHILTDGLSGNRPCVAQIMSWAAERTTTRVEDRAYSLMSLLDVNMPMLYGEGEKAFHRLQLEVIRTSNDQSIFAWGCDGGNVRTGSILADGPSFFKGCSDMELMDPDEFIESLKELFSRLELPLIDQDRFGTFPITNRGIQIWMLLCPYNDSDSVFRAWLPCCCYPLGPPVYINLAPWNFNYYRYSPVWKSPTENSPQFQFCQVYLRYQDVRPDIAFEIDSSAVIDNGFTCCDVYPLELTQNALTLTATSTFCARTYSERRGNGRFAVVFGQHLGRDWIHLISDPPRNIDRSVRKKWLVDAADHVQPADPPSRGNSRRRIWIRHIRLPESTWIVRTCRIVWESLNIGVRMEVFRDTGFHYCLEWKTFDVEVSGFLFFISNTLRLFIES